MNLKDVEDDIYDSRPHYLTFRLITFLRKLSLEALVEEDVLDPWSI